MTQDRRFESFTEFWPFYLGEHSHSLNRLLHFIGSSFGLVCLAMAVVTANLLLIPLGLILGYGFAWVGHFFVERNKPATFQYPLWSFAGDWKMWALMLTGRISNEIRKLDLPTRA